MRCVLLPESEREKEKFFVQIILIKNIHLLSLAAASSYHYVDSLLIHMHSERQMLFRQRERKRVESSIQVSSPGANECAKDFNNSISLTHSTQRTIYSASWHTNDELFMMIHICVCASNSHVNIYLYLLKFKIHKFYQE
jgi:hypothetical protein